jgi:hypothetical protein
VCRVKDGIAHIPELVPLQLTAILTTKFTGYSYIDYYMYVEDAIAQIKPTYASEA